MRTARLMTVSQYALLGGCTCRGYLPGGCTCPEGGVPTRRGCTCPRGVYLPRGVPAGGVPAQVLSPLWTEFLTHASENITLPQTSFAGGNKSICVALSCEGVFVSSLSTICRQYSHSSQTYLSFNCVWFTTQWRIQDFPLKGHPTKSWRQPCIFAKISRKFYPHNTVADPGFSRGGGVNPPGGAWTRQIFPKTAWNRKNLDAQGGACVPHAPP